MNAGELKKLLRGFDVPAHRKDKTTPQNLRWLVKNLGARNSGHPRYADAVKRLEQELG